MDFSLIPTYLLLEALLIMNIQNIIHQTDVEEVIIIKNKINQKFW